MATAVATFSESTPAGHRDARDDIARVHRVRASARRLHDRRRSQRDPGVAVATSRIDGGDRAGRQPDDSSCPARATREPVRPRRSRWANGTVSAAAIDVRIAFAVSGSLQSGSEQHRVGAERGGVPEDRPDVVGVGDTLEHHQPAGAAAPGAPVERHAGRSPIARQPRCMLNPVTVFITACGTRNTVTRRTDRRRHPGRPAPAASPSPTVSPTRLPPVIV